MYYDIGIRTKRLRQEDRVWRVTYKGTNKDIYTNREIDTDKVSKIWHVAMYLYEAKTDKQEFMFEVSVEPWGKKLAGYKPDNNTCWVISKEEVDNFIMEVK